MKLFFRSALADSALLLFSTSTLICCALPAVLVGLGFGATMAGLASSLPGLIWVSEQKVMVFGLAGGLLLANGAWQWATRNAPCPIDPVLRQACLNTRRRSKIVFLISLAIFLIGAFFAFSASL
jgi:small-conductance mechanosensitive channel